MAKIGPDEFQRVFQLAGGQLARTEYLIKEQANMSPDQLRQLIDGQQQKVLQQARRKGLGHWGHNFLGCRTGTESGRSSSRTNPGERGRIGSITTHDGVEC